MKSIITTYPDFQGLPRGIKKLLLASETFFFSNHGPKKSREGAPLTVRIKLKPKTEHFFNPRFSPFGAVWRN